MDSVSRMRLKAVEEVYKLNTGLDESVILIKSALEDVGLKNVVVKKYVPPRYLLMEYSPSWVGKALEIEFLLKETDDGTEVSVKWPYTRELPSKDETQNVFLKEQNEARKRTALLIKEFKKKIGAC